MKKLVTKIDIICEKIFRKIKDNLPYFVVLGIIFAVLFLQHDLIAMYFDDFGNASLSYNQTSADIPGTNYTLSQLWEWVKITYTSWGGRVLYAALILIPLLKTGVGIYMFLQSIVITLIFYFCTKISEEYFKKKNYWLSIVLLCLYLLIDMVYLRHGIYWASASILYIWPLLPFVIYIYLMIKLTNKIKNSEEIRYYIYIPIMLVLNFFATFSQEQIGTAMLVFTILFIALEHVKNIKQYLKIDILNLIVCIASFVLLIAAPGNWVRMDSNVDFANLSLFGKIMRNLPAILNNIFGLEMNIFMYILTVIFIACIFKNKKEINLKSKKIYISLIGFIILTLGNMIFNKYHILVSIVYGVVWILYIGIWIIYYCYKFKRNSIVAIAISACSSIFCLLVSPVVGGRTCLPFIFIIFILIIIFLQDLLEENNSIVKMLVLILCGLFFIKGGINYYINYKGYLNNYSIENLNYDILKKHKNTTKENIKLYKSKECWFGSTRSYEEPSMDYWIKEYFEIPQDVEFIWEDIYEGVR